MMLLMKHTDGYQMQLLQADIISTSNDWHKLFLFGGGKVTEMCMLLNFDGQSILTLKINSNKEDNCILGQKYHR